MLKETHVIETIKGAAGAARAWTELRASEAIVLAYDPKIKPDDSAPFMSTLRSVAGMVLSVVLVLCGVAFLIAVVVFVFGKVSKNSHMSENAFPALIWIMVGAALAAGVSGAISWASGLTLF